MRHSPRNSRTVIAALLAVAVHVGLALFLIFGVHWQSRRPEPMALDIVPQLAAKREEAPPPAPSPPAPRPKPPEPKPPEPVPPPVAQKPPPVPPVPGTVGADEDLADKGRTSR